MGKQTQTSNHTSSFSAQEAVKGLGQQGKTAPFPGELRARQQGEDMLKPTIYRNRGAPSVQHAVSRAPWRSWTVTLAVC